MAKNTKSVTADQQEKLDMLIPDWLTKKNQATVAVETERSARQLLMDVLYPEGMGNEKAGTDNWEMPGGFIFTVEKKVNVTVDASVIAVVKAKLSELPVNGDGELHTIDAAIRWKPDFSTTGYAGLSEETKKVASEFGLFSFRPGSPQLELKPPKPSTAKASSKDGVNPFAPV